MTTSPPPATPPPPVASAPPPPPTRQELLLYSTGNLSSSLGQGVVQALNFPIFNMLLGVSPGFIGSVAALARLWDAFTDPVMGYLSDGTRSRWGRRRPYILAGGFLIALVLAVFFQINESWSENTLMAWYFVGLIVFFTATTIFLVPYVALGMEIATDYDQRTRVVAYRSFVDKIAGIAKEWMFRFVELFSSTLFGAKVLALIVGFIAILAATTTAVTTRERTATTAVRGAQLHESLWRSVANVLSNPVYVRLLVVWVVLTLNQAFFIALGTYLNVYYVFGGDRAAGATLSGAVGTLGFVLSIAAIPLATSLCQRFGKHQVLRLALGLYIVGSIIKWWVVTPAMPYAQLVLPFFFGIGISSVYLVMSSMQADIVDHDELRHGGRREGMFSAVGGWIMKLGAALALALSGWILVATGFDVSLGGEQPDHVFWRMRVCFSFAPIAGCLIALLCLRNYPLTRARLTEIRAELAARRTAEG